MDPKYRFGGNRFSGLDTRAGLYVKTFSKKPFFEFRVGRTPKRKLKIDCCTMTTHSLRFAICERVKRVWFKGYLKTKCTEGLIREGVTGSGLLASRRGSRARKQD